MVEFYSGFKISGTCNMLIITNVKHYVLHGIIFKHGRDVVY